MSHISALASLALLIVIAMRGAEKSTTFCTTDRRFTDASMGVTLTLLAAAWLVLRENHPNVGVACLGGLWGLVFAWVVNFLARPAREAQPLASVCVGVATVAVVTVTYPEHSWVAGLGALVGLTVAGGALERSWLMVASLVGFGCLIVNQLGGAPNALGVSLGLVLVAASAVEWFAKDAKRAQGHLLTVAVWGLLAFGAYFLFASSPELAASADKRELGILFVAGVAIGALCCWASGTGSSVASTGLQALLWLAAATYAFSVARGLGMAVIGFAGISAATLGGSATVVAAATPVLGLAAFRAFRDLSPDLSRAFDIGQHYALIGLLVGVVTVAGLLEWYKVGPQKSVWARLSVGAMVSLVIVGALGILGPKGGVGLLIGFGLGPLFAAIGKVGVRGAFGLASAGMSATMIGYPAVAPLQDWTTDRKMNMAIAIGIAILVLAGIALQSDRRELAEVEA